MRTLHAVGIAWTIVDGAVIDQCTIFIKEETFRCPAGAKGIGQHAFIVQRVIPAIALGLCIGLHGFEGVTTLKGISALGAGDPMGKPAGALDSERRPNAGATTSREKSFFMIQGFTLTKLAFSTLHHPKMMDAHIELIADQ